MRLLKIVIIGFIFSLSTTASHAQNSTDLVVSDPYMPSIPPVSNMAVVYLGLRNNTDHKLVIIGVDTQVARYAMIHQTRQQQGVAKMVHQDKIEISAGESVNFSPGGTHIMLMGINHDLLTNRFTLNLQFADGGRQSVEVTVKDSRVNKE